MRKQSNIPALRFPSFKGEWERKELGDICSNFKSGNGITSKQIKDAGSYPVYGGNGLRGFTDSYTHDGFYVLIGRQGALCGNITRVYGKSFISEHAVAVQANNTSDTEWLAQKLEYMNLNQYSESSAQPGLAVNKLIKLKINLPTLPEQQKIASFFTAIDKKIAQLKQQKEKLELYKKGVMQQIFSQQLRFKTDKGKDFPKWEKKKLGEVYSFISTNSFSREMLNYENGEIKNIHYGDIHTKFKSEFDIQNEEVPFINPEIKKADFDEEDYCKGGDMIFADASEDYNDVGKAIEIINTSNEKIVAGLHTIHARPNPEMMATGFGAFLMKAEYVRLQVKKEAHGTKVLSISPTRLSQIELLLPAKEEQTKIASFLSSLDEKINKVQQQLQQAEQWKKGLLQQMFV